MWLALMVASASAEAPEAEPGTIRGRILDEDGLEIPGVVVSLAGATAHEAQTDAAGRYAFTEIPPGTYRLSTERLGFVSAVRDELVLAPGAVLDEELILLVEDWDDARFFFDDCEPHIDPGQLDAGLTLREWFARDLPTGDAFPLSDPMAAGVGSREAAPDRLLWGHRQAYRIDGANVSDPITGAPAVNLSPEVLASRDRFHTVIDPQAATGLDGGTMIYTQMSGNTPEGTIDFRADGWRLRSGATVGGPIMRDRIWLHADHSLVRTADVDAQTLSGKLTVQPSAAHRVRVSARAASPTPDQTELPEVGVAGGGGVVAGVWDWFWSPQAHFQTQAAALRLDESRWRADGGSTLRLYSAEAAGLHDFKAGYLYTGEGDEAGVSHHHSAFVLDSYQPGSTVTIVAGLRAERSVYAALAAAGMERVQALGPRVGVSWAPGGSPRTALKAAGWRTHSMLGMQLTAAQLSSLSAAPAAPRTDGVMLGAEQRLGEVVVQAYHSWRSAQNRYRIVDDELVVQSWQEQRLDVQLVWDTRSNLKAVGLYTRDAEDVGVQQDAMVGVVGWVWGDWEPRLGLFGAARALDGAWSGTVNGRYWQRIPVGRQAVFAMLQLDGIVLSDDRERTARAGLRYEW